MRAVLAAISLCALTLSVTACGERAEPTGPAAGFYPVTVTGANGSSTRLESPPRRILAIGPDMAATLAGLGVGGRTVSGTADAAGDDFDLVAVWASNQDANALSQRPAGAAPAYVAADRTIAAVERSLADLGVLVGRPLQGRGLVTKVERDIRTTQRHLQNERSVPVFLDTGLFIPVSGASLRGNILSLAGGENIARRAPQGRPFDLRELERLDPRYYLATSDSGTTLEQLQHNPATKRLGAVRAKRFATISSRLLQPGPQVGAGVVRIARILHPDAFR